MRKSKGFTLIELLVVIAIIALLLAVLFPALRMAKEHGKRLLCGINFKSIGTALTMYAEQQDDELPMAAYQMKPAPGSGYGSRRNAANPVAAYMLLQINPADAVLPAAERLERTLEKGDNFPGNPGGPPVENLAYLMKEGLIEDYAELIYCPSNMKGSGFSFEDYGGNEDWPRGLGAGTVPVGASPNRIRVSTSYLPQSKLKKHPVMSQFPDQAYKYSKMDPSLSVVMDLLKGNKLAHKVGTYTGSNLLYGDGSVIFRRGDDRTLAFKDLIEAGNHGQPELWREAMRVMEQ